MKKDIEDLANSDPALRDLLEFKSFFMYGDWKLFRERRALALAENLSRKLLRSIRLFAVLVLLVLITKIPDLIDAIRDKDLVQVSLSTIILTLILIGGPYLILSMRERRRAIQHIIDRLNQQKR